jgi:hypothetical protein
VPFYVCRQHRRRGTKVCRGITVPLRAAEDALLDQLEERLIHPDVLGRACDRVLTYFEQPENDPARRRTELQQRRAAIEQKIQRLVDALAEGTIEKAVIAGKMNELIAERKEVDGQLDALAQLQDTKVTRETVNRVIAALVKEWRTALRENAIQARQMIQKCVEGPIVFKDEERAGEAGYRIRAQGSDAQLVNVVLEKAGARGAKVVPDAHVDTSPAGFEPAFWP